MLTLITITSALFICKNTASFLQCSASDSLESLDDLQEREYAEKQGVICEEWPFYAGGFAKHSSSSSSSSSSEEEHDNNNPNASLLPESVTSDSILYGFDDSVETTQCLESTTNYCSAWVTTKKEYEEKHGCDRDHDKDAPLLTEYQLCLCADDNYGDTENSDLIPGTMQPIMAKYCSAWTCLETSEYPADYDTYSLVMDNTFVQSSSSSSSSSSSDDDDASADNVENNGDYYRFAQDGNILDLDESMELMNCWCKSSSINGEYCLNWYCESLQHDEHGCHKQAFSVDDYGWFGCYTDAKDTDTTSCNQWYGFLIDDEDRDEYRCECADDECIVWVCGLKEIRLRRNYMWYNFWLAVILWACLCGCCGTKIIYRKTFNVKCFRCRKCRMFLFYILFGFISLIHGGVPAFMFFVIISACSLCCAYKCENCKCCSQQCSMKGKWENMKKKCEMRCNNSVNGTGQTMVVTTTSRDGENSKEESESDGKKEKQTKSGHIRVNSVDLDEVDGDIQVDNGTNV